MRITVSLRSLMSVVNQTYREQLAQRGSYHVTAWSRYSRCTRLFVVTGLCIYGFDVFRNPAFSTLRIQ